MIMLVYLRSSNICSGTLSLCASVYAGILVCVEHMFSLLLFLVGFERSRSSSEVSSVHTDMCLRLVSEF